jgi:hypothetical protein
MPFCRRRVWRSDESLLLSAGRPVEMQKWEYRNHWLYHVEREVPAGERGMFGREKTATELPWLITIGKEELPLNE